MEDTPSGAITSSSPFIFVSRLLIRVKRSCAAWEAPKACLSSRSGPSHLAPCPSVSPESSSTCFTGPSVFLKTSMLVSSQRARVGRASLKSTPPARAPTSTRPWCMEFSAHSVFSTPRRSFWTARLSFNMSFPCFFWKSFMKCCITRWSKPSPPRHVSPFVTTTSKTPLSGVRWDPSKATPPRRYTRMFFSVSLPGPSAMAAAVGSLMMRRASLK
mmetsp:Transcript_30660/g.96505  ORF Transcript_30660/g.96505 Transcript_30660/m.96505 type:complete len:215 (+) Transcript_30660:63-707(+)